ncbi:MAG: glycerol-3-phosphate 1-O-acyltransferase PlsY, partial [Alphaproteobacteria bacterium]
TRLAGTQDLRTIGSGNIGATNVLRTGRKGLALATFVGDALKGTVAVFVAARLWGAVAALLGGLGAFLGHLFPVWLGFKGGKGVSTYVGVLLALAWPAVLAFAAVWIATAAITRYSSLAGLLASLATPILLWMFNQADAAELFVLLTLILWAMHRENISRLLAGTESQIGRQASD